MHAISNNTYLKAYTKHIQMGVFGLADQNFKITIINMPQNLEDKMDKRMKNINNFNRRWETKENLEFKKKIIKWAYNRLDTAEESVSLR